MSEEGQIPQSPVLSEADPGSLTELMSRDPEGLQAQDRAQIIRALRADRERREKIANDPSAKPKRAANAEKGTAQIPIDPEALGL